MIGALAETPAMEWPHQHSVNDVWEDFLVNRGEISLNKRVRGLVLNSWQRSLCGGVNPAIMVAPIKAREQELTSLRERNRELRDSAAEIMRQALFVTEIGSVLFLTDPDGITLDVIGDQRTLGDAHAINLVPGSAWSEVLSGSNAVGTALSNQGPVQVHGEEHFCQGFKAWTCTASPISDPYDGRILGVIDLSGLRNVFDRYHLPLVISWARHIESRIALRSLETWSRIEESMANRLWDGAATLLFDASGRLINRDRRTAGILAQHAAKHGFAAPGAKTLRVDFAGFGAKPGSGDAAGWLRPDWVDVVRDGQEVIGFAVSLPTPRRPNPLVSPAPEAAAAERNPAKAAIDPFSRIIGGATCLMRVVDQARRAAPAPFPVLLLGETGVGKELFAQAIHEAGPTPNGPFVALNCAAFSRELLAGELFGHVEGAFTGARRGGMIGKIEAADGGTLFLDEIAEMQPEMQPMLLRVLQERQVCRIGAVKPRKVSFRLIAATNRDLARDVREGRFRQDLFFRMSNVVLDVPALRERAEDIPQLAQYFLDRTVADYKLPARRLDGALVRHLQMLSWPGNVRELGAKIEALCFMAVRETITLDDFEPGHAQANREPQSARSPSDANDRECAAIRSAIGRCGGNLTAAARDLKIAKSTLYLRIRKYRDNGLWVS